MGVMVSEVAPFGKSFWTTPDDGLLGLSNQREIC